MYVGYKLYFDQNIPNAFINIWIVPVITGILLTFFLIKLRKTVNIFPFCCLKFLVYLRNIVAFFSLYIGDYASFFSNVSQNNINKSISLLLAETITLLTYAFVLTKRKQITENVIYDRGRINNKFSKIVFLLIIVSVCLVLINPSFLKTYTSIWGASNIRTFFDDNSEQGVLYTLFTVIMPIAYLSVAIFFLDLIRVKRLNNNLCLLCLSIPLLFMNGSDAFNIFCVLCLSLVALKFGILSIKKFNLLVIGFLTIIILFVAFITASETFGADSKTGWQMMSEMFQAYAPGITNMSGIYNVPDDNKLTTLFFDLYSAIPFRNTLFGIQGETKLVIIFTQRNDAISQILPCISQLYYYFGYFGVLIECIYIHFAFKVYNKSASQNNPYSYFIYILLFVYLIATPAVYNTTIFLARFFSMILPTMILYNFCADKNKRYRKCKD